MNATSRDLMVQELGYYFAQTFSLSNLDLPPSKPISVIAALSVFSVILVISNWIPYLEAKGPPLLDPSDPLIDSSSNSSSAHTEMFRFIDICDENMKKIPSIPKPKYQIHRDAETSKTIYGGAILLNLVEWPYHGEGEADEREYIERSVIPGCKAIQEEVENRVMNPLADVKSYREWVEKLARKMHQKFGCLAVSKLAEVDSSTVDAGLTGESDDDEDEEDENEDRDKVSTSSSLSSFLVKKRESISSW